VETIIECGDCGDQLAKRGGQYVHSDDGTPACHSRAMADARRARQGRPLVGQAKCATVGCRRVATRTITYDTRNGGKFVTEDVCDPCADSYSCRPVLTNFRRA
jgi:hypothetical protein